MAVRGGVRREREGSVGVGRFGRGTEASALGACVQGGAEHFGREDGGGGGPALQRCSVNLPFTTPLTSRAPPDVPSSIVQTLHQLKVSFDRLPSALWTTLTCRLPKSDPQAFAKILHDVVGVRMLPTPGDVYFVAFESQRARDKAALDLNVRWEHLVVDKIGTPDWE